jgi:hypothetical protein
MPGNITGILHQAPLTLMGEEQRLGVDTNCQRKSITLPVTVVLGRIAAFQPSGTGLQNPRQMSLLRDS